jgi:hypothetical protein
MEFEEEIQIYEDLLKSHDVEINPDLKLEKFKRLDQWSRKIQALRRHRAKHKEQRQAVQKWKDECKNYPGTCLVYEDFCNMYESNCTKMLNLIMVVIYWDETEEKVMEKYYDTFCRGSLDINDVGDLTLRGSQDNHVYRQVWLEAFRKGVFDKFHTRRQR